MEANMTERDLAWLAMAFLFMMVIVPMLAIMTISTNSSLPMAALLWIGTPFVAVCSVVLAYWMFRRQKVGNSALQSSSS